MTKKKTGARRSTPASSSSSRTSHSNRRRPPIPIPRPLLIFAAVVALLAAAAALVLLPLPTAASSSSSPLPGAVGHMQRILQPLTKNASPLLSRFRANGLFAQKNANVASPYSTKPTMSSNPNTVDADSFHPKSNNDNNDATDNKEGGEPVLPLPAPGDGSAEALQLNLGGDGVKLDALGPMVVNSDGSLSRIANWDRMAEIEKRNTLRVIGKRNKERLARLRGE